MIYIETSCIKSTYTGIGKTIKYLVETLKQTGFQIKEVCPDDFHVKETFGYYNYVLPRFCKRNLTDSDIFLIPNNMGKFWILPHQRTWVLMHDLIPLSKYGYCGMKRYLYMYKTRKIKSAQRIITISHYVKKDLCDKIGVDEDKVRVLYWPITVPDIEQPKRNSKQYLSIGTGEPRKCVDFIINNWLSVAPSDATLLLYGGEWNKGVSHNHIKNLIKNNGIENRVRLLGRVSDEELSRLYGSSQCFIYPSLEEGFGLPPLEALSQGCNIILPKTPINYELYSGIAQFYSSGDVYELQTAIQNSLVIDEKSNIEFSKRFDENVFKDNILKIFNYE